MARSVFSGPALRHRWTVPALAAAWLFWAFGYQVVWRRLGIQLDGVVTTSQDVPPGGGPRYITRYTVRDANGLDQLYTAGPTDSALKRSLPVGTRIHKESGRLGYEVDGRWIAFPAAFYSIMLGVGVVLVVVAARTWWRDRAFA